MTHDVINRTYSAVLCRSCREPIPVPTIVTRMRESDRAASPNMPQDERVFTLRCRACEAEKPYRSSQVVELAGEPKLRRAPRLAGLARTAHA